MIENLLILFNERVDRLMRSALTERISHPQYILSYEKIINGEWICADGVTEDAIDAFVLNVRLLVQDRDGFSIQCLKKTVYSGQTIPVELRERFDSAQREWQDHMKGRTLFKHPSQEGNFSIRQLFDVLMYGGLAHVNRDKVDLFISLTRRGAASAFVFSQFLCTLRLLLKVVCAIRDVNAELLRSLDGNNSLHPAGFSAGAPKPAG